jgi:hypothetical protein
VTIPLKMLYFWARGIPRAATRAIRSFLMKSESRYYAVSNTQSECPFRGQTEKNSPRANVFRVAPESRHCSVQSACLKRAMSGPAREAQLTLDLVPGRRAVKRAAGTEELYSRREHRRDYSSVVVTFSSFCLWGDMLALRWRPSVLARPLRTAPLVNSDLQRRSK